MQKIFLYTVAIIFCLTSFHSSLALGDGILRQNDSLISVDETRRTEADNTQVVGRDFQPDPLLARFLWRDASPTALPSNQELQWSEQATLDPDQLLARFLWEEEPAKQSAAVQDVILSKDAPQLARFLWRDATLPTSGPELQWSEQGTLDPDHLLAGFYWQLRDYDDKQWPEEQDLARFLWDEAPEKQVDAPQLARFLWRDATLPTSGPELQWSEQGTLDPDHLLAGFYWQLRDYDDKQWPEEQDLARFLWDEAPEKQVDASQLARFLWRDATLPTSGPELQWSEQGTLDPDHLLAGFYWQLRDYDDKQWPEEQDLARFLWDEAPEKQVDAPQLARFLWRDATLPTSGPELQWSEQGTLDPDHLLAGFYWQLRDYDDKQWREEQDLARFLWDEAPEKQVDAPQLARFLWRDATLPTSGPELQWSEQGTLDPDHLLAGFYWQLRDYDDKQWREEQDLARFLWDEAPEKQVDAPQLARFLWRDATLPTSGPELQWSEQGTLDPDHLLAGFYWQLRDYDDKQWPEEQDLARFLWDEAPEKQVDAPQLARFLWRDATLPTSGPELQWSEQGTLDPDHLLAGFYWQLRDYDDKQWPEEQDLARFLWDEAPEKQVDAPQLARFLWRDATLPTSGPELQWSEQGTLDPDHLLAGFYWQLRDYDDKQWSEEQDLAGFYWQLRDYDDQQWSEEQDLAGFYWQLRDYDDQQWSEEQDLAGFYWQLRDYDDKQWLEEQDLAGFYWQLRDYDDKQWSEEQDLAGFYWQLRDYDDKQWPEEQDLARFLWDEAPEKQVDAPQLARFLWRDAMPTILPSGPEFQVKT